MPLWQKLLVVTGCISASLTLLALFAVPGMGERRMMRDTAALRSQLVARAEELGSIDFRRPVHVDGAPAEGSFGAQAAAPLLALQPILAPLEAQEEELYRELWRQTSSAEREAPPAEITAVLPRARQHLGALLAATRLPEAGPIDGMGPLAISPSPRWKTLELAAWIFLWTSPETEGAAVCLGALALARDARISGGLAGAVSGARITLASLPRCRREIAGLRDGAALSARLEAMRAALPEREAVLDRAFSLDLLERFGVLLTPASRQALPAPVRAFLDQGARSWQGKGEVGTQIARTMAGRAWAPRAAQLQAVVDGAVLGRKARDAAFLAAETRRAHPINNVEASLDLPLASWPAADDWIRAGDAALDLLRLAAATQAHRAAHGSWPSTLSELRVLDGARPPVDGRSGARAEGEISEGGYALGFPDFRPAMLGERPAPLRTLTSLRIELRAPPAPQKAWPPSR